MSTTQLEDIGKKIAESCRGLRLAVMVMAGYLSTVEREPDSWWEIAENVSSIVAIEDDGKFDEILSQSYTTLPHHLRHCFLYMGGFLEDHEIRISKLVRLWVAEGFLTHSRNLVMVTERKSNGRIKSCGLHDFGLDCSYYDYGTHLNNLVHLHHLENLELINGNWRRDTVCFPRTLRKLNLCNMSLPWSWMSVVGSLLNLRVLKLRDFACIGSTWKTCQGEFPELQFLLIETSKLQHWISESDHFSRLRFLLLHNCMYLNEIPQGFGEIATLELIEIRSSASNSMMESAKRILEEQQSYGNDALQLRYPQRK